MRPLFFRLFEVKLSHVLEDERKKALIRFKKALIRLRRWDEKVFSLKFVHSTFPQSVPEILTSLISFDSLL